MTRLDFGGRRSKFKVTAGRRVGEGIHVDSGASTSIFWFAVRFSTRNGSLLPHCREQKSPNWAQCHRPKRKWHRQDTIHQLPIYRKMRMLKRIHIRFHSFISGRHYPETDDVWIFCLSIKKQSCHSAKLIHWEAAEIARQTLAEKKNFMPAVVDFAKPPCAGQNDPAKLLVQSSA